MEITHEHGEDVFGLVVDWIQIFGDALRRPEPSVRWFAADTMQQLGRMRPERALRTGIHPSAYTRHGPGAALRAWREAVSSPDPCTRSAAWRHLSAALRIRPVEHSALLATLGRMLEGSPRVREAVIASLRQILVSPSSEDLSAVTSLLARALAEDTQDSSEVARTLIDRALLCTDEASQKAMRMVLFAILAGPPEFSQKQQTALYEHVGVRLTAPDVDRRLAYTRVAIELVLSVGEVLSARAQEALRQNGTTVKDWEWVDSLTFPDPHSEATAMLNGALYARDRWRRQRFALLYHGMLVNGDMARRDAAAKVFKHARLLQRLPGRLDAPPPCSFLPSAAGTPSATHDAAVRLLNMLAAAGPEEAKSLLKTSPSELIAQDSGRASGDQALDTVPLSRLAPEM